MNRLLPLLSALLLLVATRPSAQNQGVFRSSARTVAVYATVVDGSGRLVPDLEEKHFEVYDNGRLRALNVFKSDVQPVTVVIMLDTSGSMTLNLDLLKAAAERFVLRLLPADRAKVGSFSDKIIISPAFSSNRDALVRVIYNDIQYGNPTFLWDAIDASMDALSGETGRRVVLVFTDGEDERSERTNFDGVISRAQAEDFMIYAIGLQSEIPALRRTTRPDRNLRRLADVTGGGYFELTRAADLNSTFTRVADELHRQYVLGFEADQLDGVMHKLEVRVKVPGMTARARKSYLAQPTDAAEAPAAGRTR
ncbi:MAG: VWA domain-containing protein [Acidobacteria bacterium]|nr:VWA domain-containing protein [Acidobacteriota bacterium]